MNLLYSKNGAPQKKASKESLILASLPSLLNDDERFYETLKKHPLLLHYSKVEAEIENYYQNKILSLIKDFKADKVIIHQNLEDYLPFYQNLYKELSPLQKEKIEELLMYLLVLNSSTNIYILYTVGTFRNLEFPIKYFARQGQDEHYHLIAEQIMTTTKKRSWPICNYYSRQRKKGAFKAKEITHYYSQANFRVQYIEEYKYLKDVCPYCQKRFKKEQGIKSRYPFNHTGKENHAALREKFKDLNFRLPLKKIESKQYYYERLVVAEELVKRSKEFPLKRSFLKKENERTDEEKIKEIHQILLNEKEGQGSKINEVLY